VKNDRGGPTNLVAKFNELQLAVHIGCLCIPEVSFKLSDLPGRILELLAQVLDSEFQFHVLLRGLGGFVLDGLFEGILLPMKVREGSQNDRLKKRYNNK
jgi:hypothetical protein